MVGIDSIVMQLPGNPLRKAEEVAEVCGWRLQVIKSDRCKPTRADRIQWVRTLRHALPKCAIFVGLLHTHRGIAIPIVAYGRSKGAQLEFHGMQSLMKDEYGLTDTAIQIRHALDDFMYQWNHNIRLIRLDVCIDKLTPWNKYTNSYIHRSLVKSKGGTLHRCTTIYYQEPKPSYTKLLAYSKRHKNRLDYDLNRNEFRFLSQFWNKKKAGKVLEVIDESIHEADRFMQRRALKSIKNDLYKNLFKAQKIGIFKMSDHIHENIGER